MDKQTFIREVSAMRARYAPNDAVKAQLAQVDLIAIVGPTGAGKTTIMEHSGLPYVASDVTRAPRKGETNGIDYNFRSDYDTLFQELQNGDFVQYIVYPNGEFYGTKARSYPVSGPCTAAIVTSTIPLFYTLGFRKVLPVYIVAPNYDEWMKRVDAHHDHDMHARMPEAKASLEEALADSRYHFMINDDLLDASRIFRAIAEGRTDDRETQEHAREVAIDLLAKIDLS